MLLIFCICCVILYHVLRRNDWWEQSQIIIPILISTTILTVVYLFMISPNHYTEILNGIVVSKEKDKVGCRHSYQCMCQTIGSGKNATTVCQTCYEHSYDIDWVVNTTVGDIDIDTIDSQGLREPPRWTKVKIGEPVARKHQYVNYIKSSHTLFKQSSTNKVDLKYPAVYDYYRYNHVISTFPIDTKNLNKQIGDMLGRIGGDKQVNVLVIFTDKDDSYAANLINYWQGGEKNDIIIIVGTNADLHFNWVNVHSWSASDLVNVELRDKLMDSNIDNFVNDIEPIIVRDYVRKPMEKFSYLKSDIELTTTNIFIMLLLTIMFTLGVTLVWRKLNEDN